jgi:hypothetical protein
MMKQPAENTNALREEEAQARQSASRIYLDSPTVKEEIAMRAHYYWQERRAPGSAPEQEDWERAESFVRNRIKASQTDPNGVRWCSAMFRRGCDGTR